MFPPIDTKSIPEHVGLKRCFDLYGGNYDLEVIRVFYSRSDVVVAQHQGSCDYHCRVEQLDAHLCFTDIRLEEYLRAMWTAPVVIHVDPCHEAFTAEGVVAWGLYRPGRIIEADDAVVVDRSNQVPENGPQESVPCW